MKPSVMISRKFGLSEGEFTKFIKTCPYRYKTYKIKKRNSIKKREISQPSRALKVVQRFVIKQYLERHLRVHGVAKAYRQDMNITDNAKPHLKNAYLLKMDFANFFPSFTGDDFKRYLLSRSIVDDENEAKFLVLLFFKIDVLGRLRLTIGSPGSPIISNALMYDFDSKVAELCHQHKINYTRYSDDITFSTNERGLLFEWPKKIREIISEQDWPNLSINDAKTVFSSKAHNRHVTGITITNDGQMSVGRSQKRRIRSQVYNSHELDDKLIAVLRGHIAFADQIEPGFQESLRFKYPEQMKAILGTSDK